MKNTIIYLFLSLLALQACKPNTTPNQAQKQVETPTKPEPKIDRADFGKLPDGKMISAYTLTNAKGMTVKTINYGGIITSWTAPDKNGKWEDIVLGYDNIEGYLNPATPYFGALIGRFGNRIAKGKFTLDGKKYTLPVNNIGNSLHGGLKGFDKVFWEVTPLPNENSLKLTYTSKDGEEGYPGNLTTEVVYQLTDDNALHIKYTATTDKPTVINLTQHTYFNLTGVSRDILDHEVMLNADNFLPVDKTLIPKGVKPVKNTPFDFTTPTMIGKRINEVKDEQIKFGGGYDHAWVLNKKATQGLELAATVFEPTSGRFLEVLTTEPAIQFYTGNFLDGKLTGKKNTVYLHRYGLCLETEHYPDAPNQPAFPSTTLKPNETYKTETVYRFSTK